jgi:hypothetical protein
LSAPAPVLWGWKSSNNLQSYFARLPMESALSIWDVATPQERATLGERRAGKQPVRCRVSVTGSSILIFRPHVQGFSVVDLQQGA